MNAAHVTAVIVTAAAAARLVFVGWRLISRKNMECWLGAYVRSLIRPRPRPVGPIDVLLCIADHFEPGWNEAPFEVQRQRVGRWVHGLPKLAERHHGADGKSLQHTFFFPAEEYHPEHLDRLATLHHHGLGDVEVHLHHHQDTADGLRAKLLWFTETLHRRHGLLRLNEWTGLVEYGFIHGNWALDNSLPDGAWCGVNDELTVLRDTGCYADFTFPSAPSATQPRTINSLYYATDDPSKPKSHDAGVEVRTGGRATGDLLMVQGPLTLNWRKRVYGLLPRIENGEMTPDNPPTPQRADLWIRRHIHVKGQPNWIFVKLHTHGAEERHSEVLLGQALDETLSYLERAYNDGIRYRLHYVTAREMVHIIKAAEGGCTGDPHRYREGCRANPGEAS